MIRRLGEPAPLEDADGSGTFVTGTTLLQLVLLGCFNAVAYNWVHNKVIAATSATTTTVLGNVKVAMLVLFSRILFGRPRTGRGGWRGGGRRVGRVRDVLVRETQGDASSRRRV